MQTDDESGNGATAAEVEQVQSDRRVTTDPSAARNVLVADDDPLYRRLMYLLLRQRGYGVLLAETGRRALDELQARPDVSVALVDLNMPDLDGYMVASSLRLTDPSRELHLIALTGLAQPRVRTLALHAGFDDHVCKPFVPHELFAKIETYASQRKLRKAALSCERPRPDDEGLAVEEAARLLGAAGWRLIVSRFSPLAQNTLRSLSEAVRDGDLGLVARLSHGFAGAAAQLGLLSTALLARELELAAVQGDVDELGPLLLQLGERVKDACNRLQQAVIGAREAPR